jgi:hypothetical protein
MKVPPRMLLGSLLLTGILVSTCPAEPDDPDFVFASTPFNPGSIGDGGLAAAVIYIVPIRSFPLINLTCSVTQTGQTTTTQPIALPTCQLPAPVASVGTVGGPNSAFPLFVRGVPNMANGNYMIKVVGTAPNRHGLPVSIPISVQNSVNLVPQSCGGGWSLWVTFGGLLALWCLRRLVSRRTARLALTCG